MSVTDRRGVELEPTARRGSAGGFYRSLCRSYVVGNGHQRRHRARRLCVLALREIDGLPVEVIAAMIGVRKSHIKVMVEQAIEEIRSTIGTDQLPAGAPTGGFSSEDDRPAA